MTISCSSKRFCVSLSKNGDMTSFFYMQMYTMYTGTALKKTLQNEFITRIVIVRERMLDKSKEIRGRWMTKERLEASEVYTTFHGSICLAPKYLFLEMDWRLLAVDFCNPDHRSHYSAKPSTRPRASVKSIIEYCQRFPQTLVRLVGSIGKGNHVLYNYKPIDPFINSFYIYDLHLFLSNPFLCRQWKYNNAIPEFFVEDETTTCIRRSDVTRETAETEGNAHSSAFCKFTVDLTNSFELSITTFSFNTTPHFINPELRIKHPPLHRMQRWKILTCPMQVLNLRWLVNRQRVGRS